MAGLTSRCIAMHRSGTQVLSSTATTGPVADRERCKKMGRAAYTRMLCPLLRHQERTSPSAGCQTTCRRAEKRTTCVCVCVCETKKAVDASIRTSVCACVSTGPQEASLRPPWTMQRLPGVFFLRTSKTSACTLAFNRMALRMRCLRMKRIHGNATVQIPLFLVEQTGKTL